MGVRRRDLFTLAASAAIAAKLDRRAVAQSSVPAEDQHPVGDFIVQRVRKGLRVTHRRNPNRALWESAVDGNFIIAEKATADIHAFGTPEGSYTIRDKVAAAYGRPSIDAIDFGV